MKMDNTTRAIEQELGCSKINRDEEEFDISTRSLGFDLKSDHNLKSKAMKFIVKKIFPDYM